MQETNTDYEQVGRFIYGAARMPFSLGTLCRTLELKLGKEAASRPETFDELAGRASALLAEQFGAEAVELSELAGMTDLMRTHSARMDAMSASGFKSVPQSEEIEHILSYQPWLESLQRQVTGA